MKKLMALSLALLMTLSLAACGSKTEQPSTGSNSGDAEATGFVPSFRRRRLRHLLPPDR